MSKGELLALISSSPPIPECQTDKLLEFVEEMTSPSVDVGWPNAHNLRDIWQYRYAASDLWRTFDGWQSFFRVLESEGGVVGLIGLRTVEPVKYWYRLIINEGVDQILAALSRRVNFVGESGESNQES
nr:hypothetical protein GCM10020063_008790 [Dactylosporangium thailandense]